MTKQLKAQTRSSALPPLFVPHGAPTFALRPGAAGAALGRYAAALPRPRAIVVASAHWATSHPTIGSGTRLPTSHDFAGFPAEFYTLDYPATGCPEVAREVAAALTSAGFAVGEEPERGLDHGAWVPLRMMFPHADVPVVPLSIQPDRGPPGALELGRALAPLSERGLLVIGSGNLTHNLADYRQAVIDGSPTPPYVREFADWIHARLAAEDLASLLDYRRRAAGARRAHPTEEHLLPFFVALGAAGRAIQAERLFAGIDAHVLAMDAYAFHATAAPGDRGPTRN